MTLFTGMIIIQFFYWSTNKGIVQRVLGARDLKSGQKGLLIAAVMILFLPVILNVPGLVAYHLFNGQDMMMVNEVEFIDLAYSVLIKNVLPAPLLGFFLASMLGAILSAFNSFLN